MPTPKKQRCDAAGPSGAELPADNVISPMEITTNWLPCVDLEELLACACTARAFPELTLNARIAAKKLQLRKKFARRTIARAVRNWVWDLRMPLCANGFDNIAVRHLLDVHTLLGIDGGVVLNTRILGHAFDDEWGEAGPPYDHEILITIGVNGVPIILSDVTRALLSIPRDAWQQGRSYYWEGVELRRDRRRGRIIWGS